MTTFRLLDSAVALGMTADDVVIGAGKLERAEPLDEQYRQVLLAASGYIRALVTGAAGDATEGLAGFTPTATAQLLLRATQQLKPQETSAQHYLEDLLATLGRALEGETWPTRADDLRSLRHLFLRIGQISLSEAWAMAGSNHAEFSIF